MSRHLWQVHGDLPQELLRIAVGAVGYCCLILVTSEAQAEALNASVPPSRLVVSRTMTSPLRLAVSTQLPPLAFDQLDFRQLSIGTRLPL
jgi:hypothetical protein